MFHSGFQHKNTTEMTWWDRQKDKIQHYWSSQEAADKDYCLFAHVCVCLLVNTRTQGMGKLLRCANKEDQWGKKQQNQAGLLYSGDIGKFTGRKLDASVTQYWTSASVKYGPSPPSRWFLTSDHWHSSCFLTFVQQSFHISPREGNSINAVISAAQLSVSTDWMASSWIWVTSFGWAAAATC